MEHLKDIPSIWQNTEAVAGHMRTISVKKKPYGFLIIRMSTYVSRQSIKLVIEDNGFAKATVKVNTNYRSPYQYTLYFDDQLNEIKVPNNSTHKERKMWLHMQFMDRLKKEEEKERQRKEASIKTHWEEKAQRFNDTGSYY